MGGVTVRVPAKVNLELCVGPPGDDGYHELVNVFHAVSIVDELSAEPADDVSVVVTGTGSTYVPADDSNLAVRAARLLAETAGVDRGAELRIRKSIPVAGGMAGGSADAAAALVACDALWGTALPRDTLIELAGRLGADVAFPLLGGTAVGRGRGDKLTPVPVEGALHWVFAPAEGGLSTPRVYAECDRLRAESGERVRTPRGAEALLAALRSGDPERVGAVLHNDLQPAAVSLRPGLARTLAVGAAEGALGALVSGSGPTCAFLARTEAHAADLALALTREGVCRAARCAYGPVPGACVTTDADLCPSDGDV